MLHTQQYLRICEVWCRLAGSVIRFFVFLFYEGSSWNYCKSKTTADDFLQSGQRHHAIIYCVGHLPSRQSHQNGAVHQFFLHGLLVTMRKLHTSRQSHRSNRVCILQYKFLTAICDLFSNHHREVRTCIDKQHYSITFCAAWPKDHQPSK